ncbi:MAG: hypothetical protein Q9162_005771 [Coniocarpon cinnabarinum]
MPPVLSNPPRSRNEFEVAIICALTHEADAVIALFDDHWNDSTHKLRPSLSEDKNEYTFGRIGLHNVVVVVLPGVGKKEACSAVVSMHPHFKNIQLCLVIGVCAVTPYTQDGSEIILGDIIVSSCVIQTDLGRQYEDTFERKDTLEDNLARPPGEVRGILRRFELELHYKQLLQRMRRYSEELQSQINAYAYPGTESDCLYAAEYTHMHRAMEICDECKEIEDAPDHACAKATATSCADLGCETRRLIPRKRLSEPSDGEFHASVWFGRFASGDTFLQSASHRERLREKEEVIGFDTEGSGAWEHFPTIIIKSGWYYADGHRNEIWQKHCAGNAAACAKAFLQEWRGKGDPRVGGGPELAEEERRKPYSVRDDIQHLLGWQTSNVGDVDKQYSQWSSTS